MWARVVEVMLGLWLVISPFLFEHQAPQLWANDIVCGAAVVFFGLLSFWHPTRHSRLLTLLVAFWLGGRAYLVGSHPALPAHQNEIMVALLLLLFAIVPNDASEPPVKWRNFYGRSLDSD